MRYWILVALLFFVWQPAQAEITPSQVKIYWDNPVVGPNERAPDHFIIQRKDAACSAAGTFTDIQQVGAQVFNVVDLNIQQQRTYCYRAFSADAQGNRSAPSNTAEALIPLGELPVVQNLRFAP